MVRRSILGPDPSLGFSLKLFGSFELNLAGQHISLPTRKIESLLAYLALHAQIHTREMLATLFWGNSSDEQARLSLRYALSMLRKTLGADFLNADREVVQLNPAFRLWVDAIEFRKLADVERLLADGTLSFNHLQSIISYYRGVLLADFYDDWIVPEREYYRELYIGTLLLLTQHYRSSSEYARAIEMARRILQSDPSNERAQQHLMFCLVALGNHDAALAQYEHFVAALREDLGVTPSAETAALREWITQARSESPSLAARITNLPIPLTSFVGREREMAEIKKLLLRNELRTTGDEQTRWNASLGVRLMTLTGAGGSGKTRLAIQVATDLIDSYRDGVWWVELAALADETLVPQTVAKALGVQESAQQPLIETLEHFLRGKQLLLVLDNCEHLLEACALLSRTLLGTCARLQMVTTSREPLGFIGETVHVISTLPFPNPNRIALADLLMQYAAIRLFMERARAVQSDFSLSAENIEAIGQICAQLDGIPLALELAAARVFEMNVNEIAVRLDKRFNFLTHGNRGALPRQQTLHALIAWSYDLLSENEQALLRHLAVFTGGWTLEAAEMICIGDALQPSEIERLLGRLIGKSLVLRQEQGSKDRYGMLETIRQYALMELAAKKEEASVRRRHAEFYSKFALTESDWLGEYPHPDWLARVALDLGNIQAALTWVEAAEPRTHLRLKLAMILWQSYYFGGYLTQAITSLEGALASAQGLNASEDRAEATLMLAEALAGQGKHIAAEAQFNASLTLFREIGKRDRSAWVLDRLGWLAREYGDRFVARTRLEESLTLFRELDDRLHVAWVSVTLGQVYVMEENAQAAQLLIEEGLAQFRSLGDTLGQAWSLNHLGHVAQLEEKYTLAQELHQESLRLFGQFNRLGFGWCHLGLGESALGEEDPATARGHLQEALAAFQEMGYRAGISWCLAGLAGVECASKEYARAVRLWRAAEALRQTVGSRKAPASGLLHQRLLLEAQTRLGESAFVEEWANGNALEAEQAIRIAFRLEP